MIVFTRYSIKDVISIAPFLIFTVYKSIVAIGARFSNFNLQLSAIDAMFLTKKKNREGNDCKAQDYGRVSLTTNQYLRLLCAVTLPFD